jgi:TetR/AcrR family transcriptional repressor of nem operon
MADAGLTHGGFYSYFGSKEDLVREAVTEAFTGTNAELERLAPIRHVWPSRGSSKNSSG